MARWFCLLTTLLFSVAAWSLTAEETRGKRLYTTGSSDSGRSVRARVGASGVSLPGSVVPCANCHGPDGLGRPEGGVIPSNITWSQLSKSYGVVSASGRKYPPYDDQAFARALREGHDPAGQVLDTAMPRFEMAAEDVADLLAYLKVIDSALDPGLTDSLVKLGTIMPAYQAPGSLGEALSAVLSGYFSDVNDQGGIYNRRIRLVNAVAGSESEILQAGAMLIDEQQVFALVGALIAGQGEPFSALVEERRVPLVGPLTEFSDENDSLNRYSFFLLAGTRVQQRALMDYAAGHFGDQNPRTAILHPSLPSQETIASALKKQAADQRLMQVDAVSYPDNDFDADRLVAALKASFTEVLFFLDRGERFQQLAEAAARQQWYPWVFLSAGMSAQGIQQTPEGFQRKIFLAYPTLPSDLSREGLQEFEAFHRRHGLSRRYLQAQIAVYASAKLMVEGLKKAGRSLTREKLVKALEGLYQYDTGLTPKLTFGPNRHLGADGAYIVQIQGDALRPDSAGQWVSPRR